MKIHESINKGDVDEQIFACLDFENPKSFFLFAGAGSGKTRSLVNVLSKIRQAEGQALRQRRKKVAIITYTNAACDEIKHRLEHDNLFSVSTIHSFVWELIRHYHADIKKLLERDLAADISELKEQQLKGRAGTKAEIDRGYKIEAKTKRLADLCNIKKFTYSPVSDNKERDALSHTEVISLGAEFLMQKPLMQDILIKKFPVLLIDESQDTKKELIDAFFYVQSKNSASFSLGLFGDTMQRIYSDGKESLGQGLPDDWIKPSKEINHRCPKRVLRLINKIREGVDDHVQISPEDKEEGVVRLFLCPNTNLDKNSTETAICQNMAEITEDIEWSGDLANIKTLILEHHMAARRMGFLDFFEALSASDKLRTGLLDGTLNSIKFFTQLILPLIEAKQANDRFAVARIVRKHSPLFKDDNLKLNSDQTIVIITANEAVNKLFSLWAKGEPTLLDTLSNIFESNLFSIPSSLLVIAKRTKQEKKIVKGSAPDEDENSDEIIDAWDKALSCSFEQIRAYHEYISDKARFATHQGVKGLQFPRVMVVIDDEEARGFMFSYEKLFGGKAPSAQDLKNQSEGKETSADRTRRLFYVGCSRAEKSLAIVYYSSNPTQVASFVVAAGWFNRDEIVIV